MYNGEHSITFTSLDGSNVKNTWTDWFLIPTERPSLSLPGPRNKFVEIPGMSGSYDLSDYLVSDVTYADRTGSFEFIVDNDHEYWMSIYQNVMVYLHGKRLRIILTDDPTHYYEGRFSVNEFKSEPNNSKIVIDYRVSPRKILIT